MYNSMSRLCKPKNTCIASSFPAFKKGETQRCGEGTHLIKLTVCLLILNWKRPAEKVIY